MRFHCPHCRQELEFEDDSAGQDVDCPACGKSVRLMGDAAVAPTKAEKTVPPALDLPPLRSWRDQALYSATEAGLGHRVFGGLIMVFALCKLVLWDGSFNRVFAISPEHDVQRFLTTLIFTCLGCTIYVCGYLIPITKTLFKGQADR